MIGRPKLVLASGSPRRLQLLSQAGMEPDTLLPVEIDETPERGELPRTLAVRLARDKALAALPRARRNEELKTAYIVAADTVVAVGRRILPKPDLLEDAVACLRLLSGRAHRVYSGICVITPRDAVRTRLVETRVRFKRLSTEDLEFVPRVGRMARQGGGLRDPGHRRRFRGQARGFLHQRRGSAAL